VLPPFKQHTLTDELEPRREGELVVFEHGLEFVFGDVLCRLHFVWIFVEVDVCLDEEDIVN